MDIREKAYNKVNAKLQNAIHKWQQAEADDWQWMGIDESPAVKRNQIKQHKQEVEIYKYTLKLITNDRIRNAATIDADSRENI
jgi:hypothetical protein